MEKGLIAQASIKIKAPINKVWDALINPVIIKQYMFGTEVSSDWKVGSTILWKGVWKEKPYEDKGKILTIEREKRLQYSHFSPLAGLPDVPENYHTLTYELSNGDNEIVVTLSQDNNEDEKAQKHSEEMWQKMLDGLKKFLEK